LLGETDGADDYTFAEGEDLCCSGLESFSNLTQIYEQETAVKHGV